VIKLSWTDLKLPPINLWSFPKQSRDFKPYSAQKKVKPSNNFKK